MSERDIQNAICDYLAYKKYFFYRNNNIPVYDKDRQCYRAMPKYTPKGLPDIVVIRDGQYIGLEVKDKGKKPSEDQCDVGRQILRAGGIWAVVRSIDDVVELLKD